MSLPRPIDFHKMFSIINRVRVKIPFILAVLSFSSCTQQIPGEFMLSQQQETFKATTAINTKLDILWVIDNSKSLEPVQTKVRAGIQQFAQQYMNPSWDIRVAAITTDLYLADPSFWAGPANQTSYLTTVRSGTANYRMNYLNGASTTYGSVVVPARSKHDYDASSWVTATQFPLFNLFEPSPYSPPTVTYNSSGTEKFLAAGLRIIDSKPQLGPDWAKLLPGNHDGPQLSLCWDNDETSTQYIYGPTACYHRDDPNDSQYHVGTANCASPASGETGASQCVNTLTNNSVHTGLPIISTVPPSGTPGDQNWINKLISEFQVNLTPSTIGNGGERAFQSVLQLMHDNEADPSLALFRPESLRVIIFVGDEDDQSQAIDSNQYTFGTGSSVGQGTKSHFLTENASAPFICKQLYSAPNAGYFYPTADIGSCADPAWLLPISTVKQDFDNFFHALDGTTASQPTNYFVATITTLNTSGLSGGGYNYIAQRYPALATAVGNGSLILDITQSDYSPLLSQVGQGILTAKGEFQLARAPTSQEQMAVAIIHADGTSTVVNNNQFTVSGSLLMITDLSVVQSFSSTDQISVNYQPLTSI
jgi:hypothetical protein